MSRAIWVLLVRYLTNSATLRPLLCIKEGPYNQYVNFYKFDQLSHLYLIMIDIALMGQKCPSLSLKNLF